MRILLFEYLHADSLMYADSSPSMRAEGAAMLLALSHDMAELSNVTLGVACCSDAAARLPLPPNAQTLTTHGSCGRSVASSISDHADEFDIVVPIAPECDGILLDVVATLRQSRHRVCSPRNNVIEMCADKWTSYEQLRQRNIPVIPTTNLTHTARRESGDYVVKPRHGTGCVGVQKVSAEELSVLVSNGVRDPRSDIVQPWIDGDSFSMALIGRKNGNPPIILPLARQHIRWNNNRPCYEGGEILTHAQGDRGRLHALGIAIAEFMELTCGYVGIDLMQPTGSDEFLVSEINPRFSTSYVGYRRATNTNLAAILLGLDSDSRLSWSQESITFAVEDTSY